MKINRNKNVCVPHPDAKRLNYRHKKTGHEVRFFEMLSLRCSKFHRVGNGRLTQLQVGEGLADYLLGKAGTFAALAGYAGGFAHLAIAAATFIDCFTDLAVGNASANADIHRVRTHRWFWLNCDGS